MNFKPQTFEIILKNIDMLGGLSYNKNDKSGKSTNSILILINNLILRRLNFMTDKKNITHKQNHQEKVPHTYIYGLKCPLSGKIRYIGKSNKPKNRLPAHLAMSKADVNKHKKHWIRKVLSLGKKPKLVIIEKVRYEDWQEAERKWIKIGREENWGLTNIADGGDYNSIQGSDIGISCIMVLCRFADKKYSEIIHELPFEDIKRILIKTAKATYKKFFGIGCERDCDEVDMLKRSIINHELSLAYKGLNRAR
jgi:hypothetical protein